MANSLGRFNFHKKKLIRIMKFQKWVNRVLDKYWDRHKAICDSILAEWKNEEV